MNELIARMRGFEIDHEPDGWPAIRMREVSALLDALEQQAAVIEAMREALQYHVAQTRPIFSSIEALALQPCPEVLNKVKADAVAKFARYADDYEVDKLSAVYIQRLLKG